MSASGAFAFGPVQLFTVRFDGVDLDGRVIAELGSLAERGQVRLIDLVVVSRGADDALTITEIADVAGAELLAVSLAAEGIIGEEDILAVAAELEPNTGVAIAALEMQWATELSSALAAAGGHVDGVALITAPVVNELVAAGIAARKQED